MTMNLPAPIAAYYAAEAGNDFDALARCFAMDATVRDEGSVRTGRAEISAWMRDAKGRYRHRITVLDAGEHGDAYVVSVRVEGAFPNSPVMLEQHFRVADGAIQSLQIK